MNTYVSLTPRRESRVKRGPDSTSSLSLSSLFGLFVSVLGFHALRRDVPGLAFREIYRRLFFNSSSTSLSFSLVGVSHVSSFTSCVSVLCASSFLFRFLFLLSSRRLRISVERCRVSIILIFHPSSSFQSCAPVSSLLSVPRQGLQLLLSRSLFPFERDNVARQPCRN